MAESPVFISTPTCRAAALSAAIGSGLKQLHRILEVWVIGDNYPDSTEEMVSRYADPRVKYSRNSKNPGSRGNRAGCAEAVQENIPGCCHTMCRLTTDCASESFDERFASPVTCDR